MDKKVKLLQRKEILLKELRKIDKQLSIYLVSNDNNLFNLIKSNMAIKYKIWEEEICSLKRNADIVMAKRELAYIMHIEYNYTFTRIANLMWYKQHWTVMNLVKKFNP